MRISNKSQIEVNKVNTPFMSVQAAAKATGRSEFSIRQGLRNGTVPHLKEGTKYLVDVPAMLEMMHEEARLSVRTK